jgi:hypothetical protein
MAASTAPAVTPVLRLVNPWAAGIYAVIFTSIATAAFVIFLQMDIWWLALIAFLFTGVGPVLGYQLAASRLGANWASIFGGLLGFILLILGFLLWPILVGAMTRGQSIGRLLLWSIIGFILGALLTLGIGTLFGQDPTWLAFGWCAGWAAWAATVAAAMTDSPIVD